MKSVEGYDISGLYLGTDKFPSSPNIVTRVDKGQALTHAEADFNLGSLIHTASLSKAPSDYVDEELTVEQREKRRKEVAGMYATFSYAPVVRDEKVLAQNKDIVVKVQHSTDEILEKISEETVPGNLGVRDNLTVQKDLEVEGNTTTNTGTIVQDMSVGKDLHIHGDIYCDGIIYGNISRKPYVDELAEKGETWTEEHPRKSDVRLKENIKPIENAMDKLFELGGYSYNWIKSGKEDIGVLAQEVQKVLPEAVSKSGEGDFLKVDYVKIIPLLIEAVKELQQEIWQSKNKGV